MDSVSALISPPLVANAVGNTLFGKTLVRSFCVETVNVLIPTLSRTVKSPTLLFDVSITLKLDPATNPWASLVMIVEIPLNDSTVLIPILCPQSRTNWT